MIWNIPTQTTVRILSNRRGFAMCQVIGLRLSIGLYVNARPVQPVQQRLGFWGLLLLVGWFCVAKLGWSSAEQEAFFEKRVRPILVEHCLKCHDGSSQESGLRLDQYETMMKGGDGGPILIPGDPAGSRLIQAVEYGGDLQMPPDGKLTPQQIADLTVWVQQGAIWPKNVPILTDAQQATAAAQHWAFQPIRKPTPTPITDPDWSSWNENPIDQFIFEQLQAAGLRPAPPAAPAVVFRRLHFDLIGLPPSAADMAAFQRQPSPEVYHDWVQRLLASPRYGERWGRHWLDVARYADTKGYVFQEERRYPFAYTYRDYVIHAFNNDKPYDQFLKEQIAADAYVGWRPNASSEDQQEQLQSKSADSEELDSLAALGFLTVGRRFLNNEQDIIDDRIDVVTRGLMGLTVACARCHDHKYDPIPTADYYSLYGIFNSSYEPEEKPVLTAPKENDAQGADFAKQMAEREQAIEQYLTQIQSEHADSLRQHFADYLITLQAVEYRPRHPQRDQLAKERKLQVEVIDQLARTWSGRHLTELATQEPADPFWTPLARLLRLSQKEYPENPAEALQKLWQVKKGQSPIVWNAWLKQTLQTPPATLQEAIAQIGQLIQRAVKEATPPTDGAPDTEPERRQRDWQQLRELALEPGKGLIPTLAEVRRSLRRDQRDKLQGLRRQRDQLVVTHPGAPPQAMVLLDKDNPADARILLRGNPGRPGEIAPRQFLQVLSDAQQVPFNQGSGRKQLAEAIASPNNPLTARVLVNRVWMLHFGQPLVATPGDFGLRSEPPTHPELLDYLAARFMEEGWSIKKLHTWIVTSQTWQQSSHDRPEAAAIDPRNQLLWKYNRRRLDFEALRDSLLAVSGALIHQLGGRPNDITAETAPPCRTVYAFIDRNNLPGLFRTFDFASPNTSSPRRFETAVPQQGLFLLNSPFVYRLVKQLLQHPDFQAAPSDYERLESLYQLVLQRLPEPDEQHWFLEYLQSFQSVRSESASAWQYGWGEWDAKNRTVEQFQRFTHFDQGRWQPTDKFPADGAISHLYLDKTTGHPGTNSKLAVVLRWTAAKDVTVRIQVDVQHEAKRGNGVRIAVIHSQRHQLAATDCKNGSKQLEVSQLHLKAGETVDFVVDSKNDHSFDSFTWAVSIQSHQPQQPDQVLAEWHNQRDFTRPAADPWEQIAHALLLTNEFLFID